MRGQGDGPARTDTADPVGSTTDDAEGAGTVVDRDPRDPGDPDGGLDGDRDGGIEWTRLDWWAVLVMTIASVVAVGLFTQAYPEFSPIDELQHLDYAVHAGEFDAVREGDQVGDVAMQEFSCAGVDADGFQVPPCGAEVDPWFFPDHGYNTAALQLPIYYTITGVVGRVLDAMTPMGVLTSVRMTGALWLALALALTWRVGAELRVPRVQRALAIGLFAPALQVLFTSSTVNADNSLMVGGALVALAAIRVDRGASSWWWLVAASVVSIATEPTSVLAVGVACLFLAVRAVVRHEHDDRRRGLVRAFGLGAIAGTSILFLDLVRDAFLPGRIPPDLPRYGQLYAPQLAGSQLAENVLSLVTPISDPYVPAFLDDNWTTNLNSATAVAMALLVVAAVVVHRARDRIGALAASLLAVMVLSGPLLVLYLYVHSNVYFEIPSRYGLAMMPLAMAVAAVVLVRRSVRIAVGAFAVVHAAQLGVLLVAHA